MKDKDGRVIIPGFYDNIKLNNEDIEIMKNVPDDPEFINKTIGIAAPEKVGGYYQESLQYPSLNILGMQSGYVGDQARTIVPEKAIVTLDIRLVPESDPDRLKGLLKEHILKEGYYVIDRDPTEEERLSYSRIAKMESGALMKPFRTEINSGAGKWLSDVFESAFGNEPIKIRIMGGTVPIAPFINELRVHSVIVPLVNPDNNQHGPNENLKLWNFTYGIQAFLSIFTHDINNKSTD